ncbi:MAG: aldose epimerase family protein [Candidatus Neomarinimicrobiota bacterium]
MQKELFENLPDGRPVYVYTLTNSQGMEARIINYGCIVLSLRVPDRNGDLGDVVLGYDELDGYLQNGPYFGAIVGRYGNRIGAAKFTLDGIEYQLARNDGDNHLHGGLVGFDKVLWDAEPLETAEGPALKLTYVSKDGEEGYPGTLTVTHTYTLQDEGGLRLEYLATTDKPTVLNLTHHSYFNLTGDPGKDILGHEMMIHADRFVPVDRSLIPVGELRDLTGSPLDFRTPTAIGARIDKDTEDIRFGLGYDHCWVINKSAGNEFGPVAEIYEPVSGRLLQISSTEPGLQFYSGNFLDGSDVGKSGIAYNHRTGMALECHRFPNSPNQEGFPNTVLRPGEEYRKTTVYRFSTR